MLTRLNRWYDNVKEPWRLLIALAVAFPFILGINHANRKVMLFSLIYYIMIIAVRICYLGKKKSIDASGGSA
jgi:hypothetical protein